MSKQNAPKHPERPDVDHYAYRVIWSEEDGEFVALCTEFPSLSHLAKDSGAALAGIRELVSRVVEDMRTSGDTVPEPLIKRTYSGHLQVRISPRLHRALALEAAELNRSLNRVIESRLYAAPPVATPRQQKKASKPRRRSETA